VDGVTTDAHGVTLKLNGKGVVVQPDGSFSVPVDLFEGTNLVTLEATDGASNVMTTELRLADKPGGVCFGDSGGPRLLGNVVVAVTSTGNKNCTGQSISYRLDTPGARAFLSAFVAAP